METLEELRTAAATCTNCDLYRHATQTVFGEGPAPARVMLVGEQPGDKEDLAILRAPEGADRKALMAGFVADLKVVATALG